MHLDAGTRLPNPHVASAHVRTPKQYRCYGSSSCRTDHERSRRTHDSLVLSHTASINNRSHLFVCSAHLCQNCNDRSSQSGCRDDCQLVHAPCHCLLFQELCTQVTRILFRATANHDEMSFAQSLLMPEVSCPSNVSHDRTRLCESCLVQHLSLCRLSFRSPRQASWYEGSQAERA